MKRDIYTFKAKRPGEEARKCERCGAASVPKARNQKYCSKECKDRKD